MEQVTQYADIIIDISTNHVDRVFQYRIPEHLMETIQVGSRVLVPFGKGNKERTGYVVSITTVPSFELERMKEIQNIVPGAVSVQEQMILLAWWMKERYGSTMNQALKTVLPVQEKVKAKEKKAIILNIEASKAESLAAELEKGRCKARRAEEAGSCCRSVHHRFRVRRRKRRD